jgi:hypothetical protein
MKRLNEFVIIYIDDILVYSKIVKEHVEHFEYVLNKLWQNKLFANRVKSEFSQEEMDFLRYILSKKGWGPTLRSCNPSKIGRDQSWSKEFDPC